MLTPEPSTFYKGLLNRQNKAAYMTTFTRPQTQTIVTASCKHLWDMRINQQAALKKLQQQSCSFLNGLVGARTTT
jgi:hypothetical protein